MSPFFILCPPRSYSSLVCGMLGQHPQLFGMPELNLFYADTLRELIDRQQRSGRLHGLHGLLRALAQLHEGEQSEASVERARAWVESRLDWRCDRVFAHLSELAAPRILIDKSPATVISPRFLERMLSMFPDSNFLHITRHPRPTGKSLVSLVDRDDWVGPMQKERLDPEKVWLTSHSNITQFARRLPEGQCMRLKGEDLVADPDCYMPQICEWLGLRDDSEAIDAMKHPEHSPFACLGPSNAPYGNDPNFLESPALRAVTIEEASLDGELEWAPGEYFSSATRKLAKEFGYR